MTATQDDSTIAHIRVVRALDYESDPQSYDLTITATADTAVPQQIVTRIELSNRLEVDIEDIDSADNTVHESASSTDVRVSGVQLQALLDGRACRRLIGEY